MRQAIQDVARDFWRLCRHWTRYHWVEACRGAYGPITGSAGQHPYAEFRIQEEWLWRFRRALAKTFSTGFASVPKRHGLVESHDAAGYPASLMKRSRPQRVPGTYSFPPDYRLFLRLLHAVGEEPPGAAHSRKRLVPVRKSKIVYNWLLDTKDLRGMFAWPFDGLAFDLEYNDLWLPEWGVRPPTRMRERKRLHEAISLRAETHPHHWASLFARRAASRGQPRPLGLPGGHHHLWRRSTTIPAHRVRESARYR